MADFMSLIEGWDGYTPVGEKPISEASVGRFLDLLSNKAKLPTHRQEYLLREVITTTDFPDLFGFTLERDVLARYRAAEADWRRYCKVGTLPNFNIAELHKVQGNDTRLARVAEKGEYLVNPMDDSHYHRQVFKHGRQFDISWEATINDFLDAFADMPARFAAAAVNTESFQVTDLFVAATGPDPLLFGAPIVDVDGANVTNVGVLPLTIANLETTMQLMAAQTDLNGQPLNIRGMHLVVPPALEFTARAIITSALKMWTDPAAGPLAFPTTNVISQVGIQLHVDPWIPVIDVSATVGLTWYLFADLTTGAAMQMDFLRGQEEPEICMKNSDKVTVAGGALSPFSGDFATDNIFYRVRHVLGGTQLDPRMAYSQVEPSCE